MKINKLIKSVGGKRVLAKSIIDNYKYMQATGNMPNLNREVVFINEKSFNN